MSDTGDMEGMSREWNYHPDLPLHDPSIFRWPPDPGFLARWFAKNWLTLSERVMMVIVSVALWYWAYPSLDRAQEFALGWIAQVWAVNFAIIFLTAGGLHWFFYMRKGQGDRLKYDPRDLMVRGKQFTFGGQVRDNMFWSLGSGVCFWTGYEVLIFWAMGNGYAPILSPADHPVIFVLWFLLTPVWISLHFYWVHRALHWGPLYRIAHALHHRNINVGPWSGLSMHPVEHVIFFSSILIHLVVPAHPLHILFHMQHQSLTAATSHTGFENLLVKDRKRLALGTFHHQMHHRYFEVNYGNLEMPWDKWFGTFHDGTRAAHERLKSRRRPRA